jgi:hypothetical protein
VTSNEIKKELVTCHSPLSFCNILELTASKKVSVVVTPAKAGVQEFLVFLDSGFRRNDE